MKPKVKHNFLPKNKKPPVIYPTVVAATNGESEYNFLIPAERQALKVFQNWRKKGLKDEQPLIPVETFENEPTEGFYITSWGGGPKNSKSSRHPREVFCEMLDSRRGYKFQITMDNLLYILEYCDILAGGALQGSFVYAWEAESVRLIPTKGANYLEIVEYSKTLWGGDFISKENFVPGTVYIYKDKTLRVYLGMYRNLKGKVTHHFMPYEAVKSFGSEKPEDLRQTYSQITPASLSKCCIGVADEQLTLEEFQRYISAYEAGGYAYPEDATAEVLVPFTFEQFEKLFLENAKHDNLYFYTSPSNAEYVGVCRRRGNWVIDSYSLRIGQDREGNEIEYYALSSNVAKLFGIKEIFDQIHPYYCKCYLTNGKLYAYRTAPKDYRCSETARFWYAKTFENMIGLKAST